MFAFRTLSPTTFFYAFKQLTPGNSYNVSIVTKLLDKATDPVSHTFRTGKLVVVLQLFDFQDQSLEKSPTKKHMILK